MGRQHQLLMRTKLHLGEFALHASYNTEDRLRSPHTCLRSPYTRSSSPLVMPHMISTSLLCHSLISSFSLQVRMTTNSPVPTYKNLSIYLPSFSPSVTLFMLVLTFAHPILVRSRPQSHCTCTLTQIVPMSIHPCSLVHSIPFLCVF